MTVTRKDTALFNVDKAKLTESTRKILNKRFIYRDIREARNGTAFTTTIKPSPWFLGTRMDIDIEAVGPITTVTVRTKSQPWILGDVFDYYNQYIADFLNTLKQDVQQAE